MSKLTLLELDSADSASPCSHAPLHATKSSHSANRGRNVVLVRLGADSFLHTHLR